MGLAWAEGVCNPAVDIAAAAGQACLANHLGAAQALAAAIEIAAGKAQQLGNRGGSAFASLQLHQGHIHGASTDIHHQGGAARGESGADGRGGGFIHQGHLLHAQLRAHLGQPLAIAAVGVDRCCQHQALGVDAARQGGPDGLQEQGPGLFGWLG